MEPCEQRPAAVGHDVGAHQVVAEQAGDAVVEQGGMALHARGDALLAAAIVRARSPVDGNSEGRPRCGCIVGRRG
jgi:hypothetical protein